MKSERIDARHPFAARLLCLALGATIGFGSSPAMARASIIAPDAAPPAPAPAAAADAAPAAGEATAPAQDGPKTAALLRFSGTSQANDIRTNVQSELETAGFIVKSVALDMDATAKKVKCKGDAPDAGCLDAIGKWLNANPKTAADVVIYGRVEEGAMADVATISVYDIASAQSFSTVTATLTRDDLIVPLVIGRKVAHDTATHFAPEPPVTAEETKILAALDEPEKTPEEIAAEQEAVRKAEDDAARASAGEGGFDTTGITADLKTDFKAFCRTGPRTKRKSKEDPRDLRPKCQMGTFWGYWQTRSWVSFSLTLVSLAGMGAMYGAALGARGPYKEAVDELDAYIEQVGDAKDNPYVACGTVDGESVCYDALATEVSRTSTQMRKFAIVGDVLLGTSVFLAALTTVILFQDRRDAKEFIRQEKALKAMSNLRVSPLFGAGNYGAGLSFDF